MKILVQLILCLLVITTLQAQIGSADTSFAGDGRIESPVYSDVTRTAVQPDSKLIVATGNNDSLKIYRLEADGTVDVAFSGGGIVYLKLGTTVTPVNLLLQPDGKIVVVGKVRFPNTSEEFLIVRLNADGSLDNSFNGNGQVVSHFGFSSPSSAALDQHGRIVVGGVLFQSNIPYLMLLRVRTNGQLDTSFASNGIFLFSGYQAFYYDRAPVAIQPDGKILFGGTALLNNQFPLKTYLFRLDSAGKLDPTFGPGTGIVSNYFGFGKVDVIRGFALQPDGKILVAEASSPAAPFDPFIGRRGFVRYNSDGGADSTFGSNGKVLIDTAVNQVRDIDQVVRQKNGKILVLDDNSNFCEILRFNSNGSLDSSFATNGKLAKDLADQPFSLGISIAEDSHRLYIALHSPGSQLSPYVTAAEARKLETAVACTGAGTLVAEGYLNIPGTKIPDLTTNAKYPNSPDVTVQLNAYEYGPSVGDNYGSLIRAYVCPPETGYYTFYITSSNQSQLWLSTDDDSANISLIASVGSGVGFRDWANPAAGKSQPIFLFAGNRYFVGTLHKTGTGDDHLSVGWARPDAVNEGPIPATYFSDITTAHPVSSARSWQGAIKRADIASTASKGLTARITPNPSINYFNLTTGSDSNMPITVRIIDVTGKILQTALDLPATGSHQLGHSLPRGFYFVEVLQGEDVKRLKVLKQ